MAITNQQELNTALEAVAQFHERVPQFSGSELDASLLLERMNKLGRDITPDSLEATYYELHGEGLLDLLDNPADDLMQSGPGIRSYEPPQEREAVPETTQADDSQDFDTYEVELSPDVNPENLTVDGLVNSLSPSTLREMIQRAEEGASPRQTTLDDEINSLRPSQLAELIFKLGGK